MSKLLPITLVSLIMAALAHFRSDYDRQNQKYIKKSSVFWITMAIALILFAGLRTRYNDTTAYTHGYDSIEKNQGIFEDVDWRLGSNPGFHVVNKALKHLGFSTQSFLMFYSAVTLGIYGWFLYKYSDDLWLTAVLFLTMGVYLFTLAAIKQCVAVAFCLVATDRVIRKRYVPFVLWVIVGALFHPYALLYLLVPLLMFRPWSWKTWLMLSTFALAGFLLQPLLGTVVDITTMIGEEYDIAAFSGEGVNPFRLAVVAVPVVLSFLTRDVIRGRNDKVNNLFLNMTMLNAELMFVALFGTANYFARLANYFLVFQTLTIPWIFTQFDPKSKRFITAVACVGYFAFCFYGNAINQRFDSLYSAVTIGEYLKTLLLGA